MPHVHASFLNLSIFLAYLVIVGFLWRSATFALIARNPDSRIAKAMGVIY